MNLPRLKSFALIYLCFTLPQAFLHLINGSSFGCVAIWALCIAIGFAFVYHGGLHDTMVWLALLFIARYVGLASLLKIGLGQSLDSYLHSPIETYLMTFCTIVELYLAYRIVARLPLRRVVFHEFNELEILNLFSILSLLIGSLAFGLTSLRAKEDVELGGFRLFTDCIFIMGIVSRTAYVLRKSGLRRNMDPLLLATLILGFGFSVLSNAKATAIGCILAYLLTVVGFRRALPLKLVFFGAICIWLLMVVIAPVIHVLRAQDANNKTMSERITDIVDFASHGSVLEAREVTSIIAEQTQEILAYFGPMGWFNPIAQRIGLVQAADPIKRGIDANGYLGVSYLIDGFARLVPRILNPDKNMDSPSDVICWHAGVQNRRVVNRQSIGMVSGSYAVGGWTGVLTLPLMFYALYFLLQRLWSDTSSANVFAIYFVAGNYNRFIENEPSEMIGVLFRGIELEMAFYMILIFAAKLIQGFLMERRSRLGIHPSRSSLRTPADRTIR